MSRDSSELQYGSDGEEFIVLPVTRVGSSTTSLVLLHFLGGSARQWTETSAILSEQYECVSVDMPGFGDAATYTDFTVNDMVGQVAETIESLNLKDFVLVGHSMSGKVSLVLASQRLPGLRALILVAPSPPGPEPIPDADRKKMLGLTRSAEDAKKYLDGITVTALSGHVRQRAVEDFARCSPDAWAAWLEHGSNEDWSERIGVVQYPTLVIVGDADKTLHASAQRELTIPHIKFCHLEIMDHCGHLPMMEAPEKLGILISRFVTSLSDG